MKQRLINWLLRRELNAVVYADVIGVEKGKVIIGGKEVQDMELRSFIAEVKALENMRIWNVMKETLRADAMDRGFNKSTSFDDLKTCKLMLYNLDIFESIINIIKKQEKK